jgi:hypothetical protein
MNTRHLLGCLTLLASAATGVAAASDGQEESWAAASPIVQKARAATEAYRDVHAAMDAGYVGGPCVSGPTGGAMGLHFIHFERLFDPALDVTKPEVLIYEPLPGGKLRLVGMEFIQIDDGDASTGSPVLEGHLLNFAGAPNRYGLPAFHQIHVWAWKRNPSGTFADWNPRVSCDAFDGGAMSGH